MPGKLKEDNYWESKVISEIQLGSLKTFWGPKKWQLSFYCERESTIIVFKIAQSKFII